jgi:protein TonB
VGAFAIEGTLLALVVLATIVRPDTISMNLRHVAFVPPYTAPQPRNELVPANGGNGGGGRALQPPTTIPTTISSGGPTRPIGTVGTGDRPDLPPNIAINGEQLMAIPGVAPIVAVSVQRIRVSTMDPAKLVSQLKPVYPQIAKLANVQGTVVLHAIIGRDGSIQSLQVVSGPALLRQAAETAVWQWRYKPTLLNGQAVEVETAINVNFILGH